MFAVNTGQKNAQLLDTDLGILMKLTTVCWECLPIPSRHSGELQMTTEAEIRPAQPATPALFQGNWFEN